MRLYALGAALLGVAACFAPLADHLGYELAELVALYAGVFGAAPGIAAVRRGRGVLRALAAGLAVAAMPVAIVLVNGLRRPVCDPPGGFVLWLAVAAPTALLAAAVGAACARSSPRRAPWIYAMIFALALVASVLPLLRGPQVFAFDHLGGMYPGPIYDEAIRASPALWWFRACTLLYTAAATLFAAGAPDTSARSVRPVVDLNALAAVCLVAAAALSLQAERLHWKASASLLDAALGGRLETGHLVLHFPREKSAAERELLARDAEADVRGVLAFLGVPAPRGKVHVWLYRSPDEKRRLIGAADTSFTKPWLGQIHTNDMPAPHTILRHELVHALGAAVAHGPWGVPGVIPQMAFIEGIAVAGDWPPGEFTVHEEARAMQQLGLLPDLPRLFKPGAFYGESGPRAYTAAGSFIRFLWETRGAAFVRDAYASGGLRDVPALAAEYLRFLSALPLPPRALALAQQRFSAPAIVRKRCAHEVAGLARDAAAAAQRGDREGALQLWSRCTALEPDDPSFLLSLGRAQVAAGDLAAAARTEAAALAHPRLSQPLRAQLLVDAGDTAWKAGDAAAAAARYDAAAQLAEPEAAERALAVRRFAVRDAATWPALRPLMTDANTGPEVIVALRDLDLARPGQGVFAYLLAKQLQNHGAWNECVAFTGAALGRALPPPLVPEALRMRGACAWHAGDQATARAAFGRLADGPAGQRLEAQRWLGRL